MIRFLKNLLVLSASLLVTLGVIELGLRLFMPIDYRPPASELPNIEHDIIYKASDIPGLDYELVPNMEAQAYGVLVRTNSYGMRDDEPDPDENKRIVVLGDSFAFGSGVPQERILAYLLEKKLQANGQQYEVLNLAVAGYATQHEAASLRYKGMIWQPEIIIVAYVMNDPEIEPIHELALYFREPSWWQYSHVLRLFVRGKKAIEMLYKGGGDYFEYLHADKKSWAGVVSGFENIKEMADESNAKVIVLLFPDLWHDWNAYPYLDIHEQVTTLARANGFLVIDLTDYFSEYSPGELRVSDTDGHPNGLAHFLTTQAILENLSR